ncbi:transposase [Microbispora sp. GKU 823]|uniref:transposase n=1 Tax=Microbispora sp. GKU 823 TaxID=1652100 RepID=UPI0009C9407A|nr:transposase [Microbispora sp. GKU 823]OPG05438.1 hypothetical protein B1L11_35390 [Microbispora sp. GKU 823]
MARKQRGSNNRAKARAKVARAHTKVRDARADFLHRTSTRLVLDHDLAAGRAVSACGADVSPQGSSLRRSAAKQEAQPARAGIPVLQL